MRAKSDDIFQLKWDKLQKKRLFDERVWMHNYYVWFFGKEIGNNELRQLIFQKRNQKDSMRAAVNTRLESYMTRFPPPTPGGLVLIRLLKWS